MSKSNLCLTLNLLAIAIIWLSSSAIAHFLFNDQHLTIKIFVISLVLLPISSFFEQLLLSPFVNKLAHKLFESLNKIPWWKEIYVCVSELGIIIKGTVKNDTIGTMDWAKMIEISTYKRDLGTTDLICVQFKDCEKCLEINEEMAGWKDACNEINKKYTKDEGAWLKEVMVPAFKENKKVLFNDNN